MKKITLVATSLAMACIGLQTAAARDGGWGTAGKILTGVVAGSILTRALEPPPVYTYPAPTYYYPQPVAVAVQAPPAGFQPAYMQQPVVVYQQPVYLQPAPVYVRTAPSFWVAPIPFVSFRLDYDRGFHHGSFHRGRW